ncbi:uncharacterized protein LOC120261370 [Dioscorea cayenensis subsp. rotundata]|uniref:Uncharacterized protein LOC120261370 n=1 Tax=Dioscorea cayennensis subsp. rotundata TaxID=55577 RepID=A0AB40BD23_DIOCR|nr:uncharacterized protein LOC120261370 [Dioscorea cayenensis subsp. rotundata]
MASTAAAAAAVTVGAGATILLFSTSKPYQLPKPFSKFPTLHRPTTKLFVSSPSARRGFVPSAGEERVFFDGGAHYGDLLANLLLGFTLLWLPLTLAAVFRAFYLRYRFTNLRVTVISGLTGQDRSDFGYESITDVKVVPRFIGEWGDVVITLKDGTKVDLRSVPKFREVAEYCVSMSGNVKNVEDSRSSGTGTGTDPRGF